jgi:hypothetical protein
VDFKLHLAQTRTWFRAAGAPVLVGRAETLAAYARLSSKPPRVVSQAPGGNAESTENILTAPQRQRRITPSPTTLRTAVTPADEVPTAVQPEGPDLERDP